MLRKLLKKAALLVAASTLALTSLTLPASAASVTTSHYDIPGGGTGYFITGYKGYNIWLGKQPYEDQYCIDELHMSPKTDAAVISKDTIPSSSKHIPDLALDTSQAAWVLSKHGRTTDRDTAAAVSLLMHTNFEITPNSRLVFPEPAKSEYGQTAAGGIIPACAGLTNPFQQTKRKEVTPLEQQLGILLSLLGIVLTIYYGESHK